MDDRAFDRLYRDVPTAQRERLRRFRSRHPLRTVEAGGVHWDYHLAGSGPETLLILTGGSRGADTAFRLVEAFEPHLRVVTIGWPPVEAVEVLLDGLAGLLSHIGAERFHLLGASIGGLVAQAMMRRHPGRIDRVVLSNTGCNRPEEQAQRLSERLDALADKLALVPGFALRKLVAAQMQRLAVHFPDDETAFWQAFFTERSQRDSKADLIAFYHLFRAFSQLRFPPLSQPPESLLVLQSDDDLQMTRAMREAMAMLYPIAEHHTFHGAGHLASLTHGEAYERVVLEFLLRPRVAGSMDGQ